MIRARHRRSLAKRPGGCLAKLRELAYPTAMKDIKAAVSDVELQEFGSRRINLVRAVVTTVEIEEEGLFRGIVTYL